MKLKIFTILHICYHIVSQYLLFGTAEKLKICSLTRTTKNRIKVHRQMIMLLSLLHRWNDKWKFCDFPTFFVQRWILDGLNLEKNRDFLSEIIQLLYVDGIHFRMRQTIHENCFSNCTRTHYYVQFNELKWMQWYYGNEMCL